jgi:ADP-ribosylglycohydrolase
MNTPKHRDEHSDRLARARLSLAGLSIGDAFGETFFHAEGSIRWRIHERGLAEPAWNWTDDTAMAISIYETLKRNGRIDQDELAERFARRYAVEPWRGYGATAHEILAAIGEGASWFDVSSAAFGGEGSMGNGAAMRVGPVGAFFADDLEETVENAKLSAEVTHFHRDAQAGAIAVAVAAAMAWRLRDSADPDRGRQLLETVLDWTPDGPTHDGINDALYLPCESGIDTAVGALGNGSRVVCHDTVPFCLWCAARHLDDYQAALWTTVEGLGDRDTTCAIVGSIVALSAGAESIPPAWQEAREPLPI